jgi:hypothetical protein
MRTNVGFTSNIPRRRARFDHDAIDDGHAKPVELQYTPTNASKQ